MGGSWFKTLWGGAILALAACLGMLAGRTALAQGVVADGAGCNSNDSTAPCFADVTDILAGQRHLLRTDDLVVNIDFQQDNSSNVEQYILETSDVKITKQVEDKVVTANCFINPPVPGPVQTRIGRVFNLDRDVTVTLAPKSSATGDGCNGSPNMAFYVKDALDGTYDFVTDLTIDAAWVQIALADFDGDGFDDIFFVNSQFIIVYTAVDTDDPSKGIVEVAQLVIEGNQTPQSEAVIGDFNGDGALDAAWPGAEPKSGAPLSIYFASVCPAKGVKVPGETCTRAFEIIVSTQTIATGRVLALSDSPPVRLRPNTALAAGDFDGKVDPVTGRADAELVFAFSNKVQAAARAYDFDADLKPTEGPNPLTVDTDVVPSVFLASGKLDWSDPKEQAVLAWNAGKVLGDLGGVAVITFGDDLTMTIHGAADTGLTPFGLAVGRFDPPDSGGTEVDFDQQIAVLVFDLNTSNKFIKQEVNIFTVDPPTSYTPILASNHTVSSFNLGTDPFQFSPLVAGDLQGRSLTLGAPEKATVTSHIQPDTILGMPPMHVDYIQGLGGSAPGVLNVTVFPKTFNTEYDFADTSGTQGSRKSTTSYTYAFKELAKEKISYGIPDVAGVSLTAKQAATQAHSNSVAKTYNTYSGQSFKLTTATQFDDKVAATTRRMNIYTYPVIGKTVCPFDSPKCPDDCAPGPSPCPKLPLHVQYSGPDNVVHYEPTDAGGLEWYQPVNEPGNVFSYPGNLDQLKADLPQQEDPSTMTSTSRLQLLSPGDVAWGSLSSVSVSVDWNKLKDQDVTSGSVSNHSFNASVSVSGNVNIEGFGLSASVGFDYNSSNSVSTLNSSSSKLEQSTGITVNRGIGPDGPSSSPDFLYEGETYIFGQHAPIGTIQTDITPDATVKAEGHLRVAYAADPLSQSGINSGVWWKQAYTAAPDVALNHPARWLQKLPVGSSGQLVAFNCPVGFKSSFSQPACVANSKTPNPTNVADALFYWMKGLFATPGETVDGPSTSLAKVGDTVTLSARVYNYSLLEMPAGTAVRVRFYAQPWDAVGGRFQSQTGNSDAFAPAVFIGEDTLDPVPAFCGGAMAGVDPCKDADAPRNWDFAEATWDTSKISPQPTADTYWKFWVVAWMENGGNLVPEIQGHGLTAAPGANLNSLADVEVETYSNNLGFYNQVFTLALPVGEDALAEAEAMESALSIVDAEVSPFMPLKDETATVRVGLLATGMEFDHVQALFYDGDPEDGGELFDMEIIPRIQADRVFTTPVPYRPNSCGAHTIYVEAIPSDGSAPPAFGMVDIDVTIDTGVAVELLEAAVRDLNPGKGPRADNRENFSLVAKLRNAGRAFGAGRTGNGIHLLGKFVDEVELMERRGWIPPETAAALIESADEILDCV